MYSIMDKITKNKKKRNHLVSKKSLWAGTLKELNSLNRNIKVGELRCMDCNSNHIAYRGSSKSKYSFDISTPAMRNTKITRKTRFITLEELKNEISDYIRFYSEERL